MESLKRKLSTTRRPETTGRNLLPELNQYKQNNVALQYVQTLCIPHHFLLVSDLTKYAGSKSSH